MKMRMCSVPALAGTTAKVSGAVYTRLRGWASLSRQPLGADLSASHSVVIGAAATFGGDPGDDLVRILNVASLAVHTVGGIQADALAMGRGTVVHHLVNICRTEVLARTRKLLHATVIADVRVLNQQMGRLILLVLGAGMIEVREFVERELAVAFCGADPGRFRATVGREFGDRLQVFVSGMRRHAVAEATGENVLQHGVEHPGHHALLKSLVEIAHRPQFVMNPAGFYAALKFAENF